MRKHVWVRVIALWLGLALPGLAAPIIYQNGTLSSDPTRTSYSFNSTPTSTYSISTSFSVSVAQTAQSVMFASAFPEVTPLQSVQWAISSAINGTGTVLGSGSALVNNFYLNARNASYGNYLTTFSLPSIDLAAGSYFLTLSQPVLSGNSLNSVGWTAAVGSLPNATRFESPSGVSESVLSGYFVLYAVPELNAAQASLPLLFSALILVTFRRRSIRQS